MPPRDAYCTSGTSPPARVTRLADDPALTREAMRKRHLKDARKTARGKLRRPVGNKAER